MRLNLSLLFAPLFLVYGLASLWEGNVRLSLAGFIFALALLPLGDRRLARIVRGVVLAAMSIALLASLSVSLASVLATVAGIAVAAEDVHRYLSNTTHQTQ